jgi:AcrR family transcriptional regulator
MAPRVGLDREAVVAAAVAIIDYEGVSALSLARLAKEVGVRAPSLYGHVNGMADLRRALCLFAVADLGEVLRGSVMGRSGNVALIAFAEAYRGYSRKYPGRYELTLQPPLPVEDELRKVYFRALEPFNAIVSSWGLDAVTAKHFGRAVRSGIHGFVVLETAGSFRNKDADESFRHMLAMLVAGVRSTQHAVATPKAG